MSSLCFIKAPPRPNHVNEQIWESEWVGLMVGLASVFPLHIGYLGEGEARIFDEQRKVFRAPTSAACMNFITRQWIEPMWISREALMHACKYSMPPRPTILAWLDEGEQIYREMFAVPETIAKYLS